MIVVFFLVSATALLPLVLLPVLGVADGFLVARSYFNDTQLVLIGSFLLAIAFERVRLHRRAAHFLLEILGGRPCNLIAGFAFASFIASTLLSNTATTILVLPMAQAVLIRLQIARNLVLQGCDSVSFNKRQKRERLRDLFVCNYVGVQLKPPKNGIQIKTQ